MVAAAISSFKNNQHKLTKLRYKENMELPIDSMKQKNLKNDSYVKADQAHYFNKAKLDYYVLGTLKKKYLNDLLDLIISLEIDGRVKIITSNL